MHCLQEKANKGKRIKSLRRGIKPSNLIRFKCDGNKPCLKCSSLPGSICAYDVNTRVSKEEMKLEIVDLRRSNSLATQILAALAEDRGVSRILQGLKDREELASIAAAINSSPGDSSTALESNDSPLSEAFDESPLDSLMDTGPDDFQGSSHAAGGHLGSGFRGEPSTEGKKNNPLPWTTPLLNDILIKHLLSLYWVWIHPAYPILNIGKFFEDFENCRTKHCSAYLVNAVCAAACDLLNPHWEGVPGKTTDVAALKQHLIAEAAIQAAQADPEAATTANASAVMSLINKERFPLIQAD